MNLRLLDLSSLAFLIRLPWARTFMENDKPFGGVERRACAWPCASSYACVGPLPVASVVFLAVSALSVGVAALLKRSS